MTWRWTGMLMILSALTMPAVSGAQPLGTFRWQLQPFCNVVTMAVTQNGGVFRLEGTDNQCGSGAGQASAIGVAFQNPDGSIGFGFTIVTAPGGASVHVDATIAVATLSGTWRDSGGNSGTFVFTPGVAGASLSARPLPLPGVPVTIQLRPDGGMSAGGTLGAGTIPASGAGVRMLWHPAKAAFRAGEVAGNIPDAWDDANVGLRSVAFGLSTIANGFASTAMGIETSASGQGSTAMGSSTIANGIGSTAMGLLTTASGIVSTVMGDRTTASGSRSTAIGLETTASGNNSTAIGNKTKATGQNSTAMGDRTTASGIAATALGSQTVAGGTASLAAGDGASASGAGSVALGSGVSASTNGTFMFGDRSSPAAPMLTFVPHQFLVRASGGTSFYSNSALTTGVDLLPNANAWSSASDVRVKHHFRDLDGDDVLAKLAAMSIQEWSYKAQDASIRHVGPTAQEFSAAFGLGEDPLRISTIDADGIALRAVQALEHRDRTTAAAQASEIAALRATVESLTRQLADALAALQGPKGRQ